jgi:predicted transposase YdaD
MTKTPHDTFIKTFLKDKTVLISFLENYIDKSITSKLDLKTLKTESVNFVDEKLKDSYSDLLYSVNFNGKDSYIYLLFEHKSSLDLNAPFQMFRYMGKIWKLDKGKPIIPILIYHGKENWNKDNRFESYVEKIKGYEEFVPKFKFIFLNLKELDFKGIMRLKLMIP